MHRSDLPDSTERSDIDNPSLALLRHFIWDPAINVLGVLATEGCASPRVAGITRQIERASDGLKRIATPSGAYTQAIRHDMRAWPALGGADF